MSKKTYILSENTAFSENKKQSKLKQVMGRFKNGLLINVVVLFLFVAATMVGCDNGTTKIPGTEIVPGGDPQKEPEIEPIDEPEPDPITDGNGFYSDPTDPNYGIHSETQTKYDNEGYDIDGYNQRGFDRDGKYLDGTYYDADGYDANNDDINGFERLEPVAASPTIQKVSATDDHQSYINSIMMNGNSRLINRANQVRDQFNSRDDVNTTIRNAVIDANNDYLTKGFTTGDQLIEQGLYNVSQYLAATMGEFNDPEECDRFKLVTDTFRTKSYNDHLGHHSPSVSNTELDGLYSQLGITAEQFNDSYLEKYITELSVILKTNPGLIKTLFNQMQGFEQFYANRDDAIALNLAPIMSGAASNYKEVISTRSLYYTDYMLSRHQAQTQSQDLSR